MKHVYAPELMRRIKAMLLAAAVSTTSFVVAAAESLEQTETLRFRARTNFQPALVGNLAYVGVNDSGVSALVFSSAPQFGGRVRVRTYDKDFGLKIQADWISAAPASGLTYRAAPLDSGEVYVFSGFFGGSTYGARCDFIQMGGGVTSLTLAANGAYIPQFATALANEHALALFTHGTNALVAEIAKDAVVWQSSFSLSGSFRAATLLKDATLAILARDETKGINHIYFLSKGARVRLIKSFPSTEQPFFTPRPSLIEDGENILVSSLSNIWRFTRAGELLDEFWLEDGDRLSMLHRYEDGTVVAGTVRGKAIKFTGGFEVAWVRHFPGIGDGPGPPGATFVPTARIRGIRALVGTADLYTEVLNSNGFIFQDRAELLLGSAHTFQGGYLFANAFQGINLMIVDAVVVERPLPFSHDVRLEVNGGWATLRSTEPGELEEVVITESVVMRSLAVGAQVNVTFTEGSSMRPNVLLGVEGDVVTNAWPLTYRVEGPVNSRAVFGTFLGVTVSGEGSVFTDESRGLVRYGTNRVYALPAPGYYFSKWSNPLEVGLESPTANPAKLRVSLNTAPRINAEFEPLPPNATTITALGYGPGRVVTTPSRPWHERGEAVQVQAAPEAGAVFLGWLDAENEPATHVVTAPMEGSVTRTALFAGMENGKFVGAAPGRLGAKMEVFAAPSVEGPWKAISARTNSVPVLRFEDFAPSAEQRFYRVRVSE